jgi:hypothetical protein
MAFDQATLEVLWEEEIGRSWSATTFANGVVYAGTNATEGATEASWLYAHDAATGARLATFSLPNTLTSRVAVDESAIYVGYGFLSGGLRAYALCRNGTVDPGEDCDDGETGENECCSGTCTFVTDGTACGPDDGNDCTTTSCDGAGACVTSVPGGTCDDGDACTSGDTCEGSTCAGTVATTTELGCALGKVEASPCGDTALPTALAKSIGRTVDGIEKLLAKAAKLAADGKAPKVERLRKVAARRADGIARKAEKAARSKKPSRQIPATCRDAIAALVADWKALLAGFAF